MRDFTKRNKTPLLFGECWLPIPVWKIQLENALSPSRYRQDLYKSIGKNAIVLSACTPELWSAHLILKEVSLPIQRELKNSAVSLAMSDNRASLSHQDTVFNQNKIKLLELLSTSKNIVCVPEQLQMTKISSVSRSTAKMSLPVSQFHKLD